MTTEHSRQPVTLAELARMKQAGEKIACLTAYDASFARQAESAGVEVLLVGDSLGNVVQGRDSTLPVTLADMIYHGSCVARGAGRVLRVVDMPFMTYAGTAKALDNAARLMAEGGAHMVKLEGGAVVVETVRALTLRGIPVCAHLGLLPQSVHQLGGYRVQGRDAASARTIVDDALALEQAGAGLLVLECVPAELAGQITDRLSIPVIGIGAGAACDGQVLVIYDVLGIAFGKRPRFVKEFLAGHDSVSAALRDYVQAVKSGAFPGPEHSY
ncbi:MAG: 3-methyl-2-oxobutanoate hydroxymethyltransferase [Gammaproteobacteria bacterium]